MTLAVPWIQPFPRQREETFSVLYGPSCKARHGVAASWSMPTANRYVLGIHHTRCAEHVLGKVVNGSPGDPSSGSSHTSRKAHWPLPQPWGSFFMLPPVPSIQSIGWGKTWYKHPSVSVMGQGSGEERDRVASR